MSEKQKSFATQEEERRFWNMVFDTFHASNLSVKQFCKNEGLAEWSFYHWKKKLRQSLSEETFGKKIIIPPEVNSAGSVPSFTEIAHVPSGCTPIRIEFPSGVCPSDYQ